MDEPQSLAEGLGMGLGLVLGTAVIEVLIDQAEYQNFVFFSILSSSARSSDRSIENRKSPFEGALSLGILGQIILLIDEHQ